MCKICVDYEQGKLTWKEAWRNMEEVYKEEDPHSNEVWIKLLEEEP